MFTSHVISGVPTTLVNGECMALAKVKFLVDLKTQCSHSNIQHNNLLNADTYFKNVYIISTRPNVTKWMKYYRVSTHLW